MVGPFIKTSFDTLLKFRKVIHFGQLVTKFTNAQTEVLGGEERAGFRYGTAGPAAVWGRLQWTPGQKFT